MAREGTQSTIPGIPENTVSRTDRAATAVRDFQAGRATLAFVQSCLTDLHPGQMLVVSIATRLPVKSLEALRAN